MVLTTFETRSSARAPVTPPCASRWARSATSFCCKWVCAEQASSLRQWGSVQSEPDTYQQLKSIDALEGAIAKSQLRCPDPEAEGRMIELITLCKKEGDSLGGVVEVWFEGLIPGIGSYVQWDRRLDGRFAQALMSIQAFKGVEVGAGFRYAASRGSESHDGIVIKKGRIARSRNNSGGLEAGSHQRRAPRASRGA